MAITPETLFQAFWIIAGLVMVSKLFWMLVYELKYGKGEEYLDGAFRRKK